MAISDADKRYIKHWALRTMRKNKTNLKDFDTLLDWVVDHSNDLFNDPTLNPTAKAFVDGEEATEATNTQAGAKALLEAAGYTVTDPR